VQNYITFLRSWQRHSGRAGDAPEQKTRELIAIELAQAEENVALTRPLQTFAFASTGALNWVSSKYRTK
jgi:hypothetical protein